EYTQLNYGGVVYSKTAIAFDYLMAYLGESVMNEAMQKYFELWHFKHPEPEDLRKVLQEVSGKDLSWFFEDMVKTTKKLDYKISFANKNENGSWDIGVKNTGDIKGPVFIQGIKNNKLVGEVIYDGFHGKQALNFPPSEIDYFKIDFVEEMPEVNRNNNKIKTSGLFRKTEPVKIKFLGSLDHPDKSQIFWTPVAGWNNYNKWMFGIAVYNNILPQKKLEFELIPMFSYSTSDFAGYGRVMYNMFPEGNLFQKVSIGVTGSRYAYSNEPFDMNFNKIAPELYLEFKKKRLRSPNTHSIRYRNISIIQDHFNAKYEFSPPVYSRDTLNFNFNDLTYTLSNKATITPYSLQLNVLQGEKILKTSLTAKYSYNFKRKNKGIDVRFFAGTFIGSSAVNAAPYRFRLSGQRGYQDYLYDNIFLGRSERDGVLGAQFRDTEGAFKVYSPLGQSAEWIAALNLKSSIGTLPLPINLYADIGTTGNDGLLKEKVLYNAGVCLSFRKNIFEIYFPLLMSKEIENYNKINGISFLETIRFTLNLNMVNPFDLVRNFSL
nr:hypothetical protein [Bacteroidota bacterium]